MEVRAALSDELAVCAALYDRVVRETFSWLPIDGSAEKFRQEAAEEEVYVAVNEGRILALASFYRPDNFLHSLYVDRDARGLGAGTALLAHVRGIADGPVSLKVQKLNTAAIDFYRRRGMEAYEEGDLDAEGGGWIRMR